MATLVRGELIPQREMETNVSNIDLNPIDVVEKLGKYEFIYDYNAVPAPIFYDLANNSVHLENEQVYNELAIMQPDTTSYSGDSTSPYNSPQPVRVNSNSSVGVFSKGNVVEVVGFNGSNAVVKNPNYVPALTTTNSGSFNWAGLIGNPVNMKEFNIPKEYLSKVDDSSVLTVSTGINYGANMKPMPKPVYPINQLPDVKIPLKPIADQLIEQNSTYVLNKDFGYNKTDNTNEHIIPDLRTLTSGTKVTGNVFRPIVDYKAKAGVYVPENRFDYLEVKGLTDSDSLKIPLLNLTKDIPTNSGVVVPANNNNNHLLLIAGAFIIGYALFSDNKSSN